MEYIQTCDTQGKLKRRDNAMADQLLIQRMRCHFFAVQEAFFSCSLAQSSGTVAMQSSEYISIWGTDSVSSDWMTNTRAWFSLLSWNGGFSQSLKLNCRRWKFWPNLQIAKHEESAIATIHFWTALCLVIGTLQLLQSRGVKLCVRAADLKPLGPL